MTVLRRGRLLYWFARDLVKRYTRSLLFGFFIGLLVTLVTLRFAPIIISSFFRPVERIGIVGQITPSTLPASIQNLLSMGLTTLTDNGSAAPGLASSWVAQDGGKEFVFTLKKMSWHNGKEVQAEDINYNIQGVTFQAVDSKTVKATLPEAYSPFPTLVSKPLLQVGLRGAGPYKVGELRLNGDKINYLVLVPVFDQRMPLKTYTFYQTETQAIAAYKNGNIDSIEEVSSADLLKKWGQTVIEGKVIYDRIIGLYLNLRDPVLSDKVLRQTLAYATPEFSEEEAFSPIPKTSWAYYDAVRHFIYDNEQAKKNIANVKFPEKFSGLTITTFPQYVEQANKIADSWKTFGISTTVKVTNQVDEDFQILLSAQDLPPDPDQYPFWHSKQGQTNLTGYTNLKVDKLLEDGRREMDQEKRIKIYADFQRFLVEDVPVIFLYHPKTYSVVRRSNP